MPLAGVVFDFDGVIADTESLHLRAYQDTLINTPLSLTQTSYYEKYLGFDDVGVFTALAQDSGVTLGNSQITQLVSDKGRRFESLLGTDNVLFPGAADCIRRLEGTVRLAIASGALHHEIESILVGAALRDLFTVIVAADDVSRPKPAPDAYLAAVSSLAVTTGTSSADSYIAVEDSPWGLESAHAAGLKTIGVTNSYPKTKLATADIVVEHLDAVDVPLLERLRASP
jgi:beta-phosphoglucomutase-like phosphatase (HAD superfamily)